MAGVLLASSLFLIVNTIRLATFARRREIEVMKLVGASNWFVRIPFMAEGLVQGAIGAGLAFGLVFGLKVVLSGFVEDRGAALWRGFYLVNGDAFAIGFFVLLIGAVIGDARLGDRPPPLPRRVISGEVRAGGPPWRRLTDSGLSVRPCCWWGQGCLRCACETRPHPGVVRRPARRRGPRAHRSHRFGRCCLVTERRVGRASCKRRSARPRPRRPPRSRELAEIRSRRSELDAAVAGFDARIRDVEAKIAAIQADVDKFTAEAVAREAEAAAARAELDEAKRRAAEAAAAMYRGEDGVEAYAKVLDVDNLQDAFSGTKYLAHLSEKRRTEVASLAGLKVEIEKLQQQAAAQRDVAAGEAGRSRR